VESAAGLNIRRNLAIKALLTMRFIVAMRRVKITIRQGYENLRLTIAG
jgi:hypothetical protein